MFLEQFKFLLCLLHATTIYNSCFFCEVLEYGIITVETCGEHPEWAKFSGQPHHGPGFGPWLARSGSVVMTT